MKLWILNTQVPELLGRDGRTGSRVDWWVIDKSSTG